MATGYRLQLVVFGVSAMYECGGRWKLGNGGYLLGREGGVGGGRRLSAGDVERL